MGKVIHLNKVRELLKKSPVFRAKDVEHIVKDKNYSSLLLHNMVKRGEVNRVTKGWYSLHEDPIVSVFCFKPAYIGLQEALSLHELWEQETNIVIVTTRNVRMGVRKVLGSNVIFHRIGQKYFFGFDYMRYGDLFIPVSDPEKTLIDLFYFNEFPGGEVIRHIKGRIDRHKLLTYLDRYPQRFRRRVRAVFR